MAVSIRAHYDGKTFVPDEPVNLQEGEQVQVFAQSISHEESRWNPGEAKAALARIAARAIHGLNIPDEALRRENMYEDRL